MNETEVTTFVREKNLEAWSRYFVAIKDQLGAREKTFETIFDYLIDLEHPPLIVETGTYREENNYTGDGCSTILFDNFVDCFGGNLFSVDIDPDACELARGATKHAQIVESDSVEFLGNLYGRCDLLYLDSYNIQNWYEDWAPSAHHLKELFAAKNIIRPGTLIVVDDNITTSEGAKYGKGRVINELMEALGIEPLFESYQIGWVWQEPEE